MLINLERVGKWTDEESIHYVTEESDVNTRIAANKIYRILNYKRVDQMEFAYRNTQK